MQKTTDLLLNDNARFKEKYPGKSNPDLKGNVYDGLQKMRDARISSSLCQCLYSDSACSENLV